MAVLWMLLGIGVVVWLTVCGNGLRSLYKAPLPTYLEPLVVALLGSTLLGFIGVAVALVPGPKSVVSAIGLLVPFLLSLRHWHTFTSKPEARTAFALWAIATLVIGAATHLPVKQPALYDGPYVFKEWRLPVQMQALAGDLPPDNALAAVATEFMAQGIPFTEVRPLMPGQEVSNRPLLMALAALPLRVFLPTERSPVTSFEYVGTVWPNTLGLVTDRAFRVFLSAAVPLNSIIVLGFWAAFGAAGVRRTTVATLLFAVLSPYVVEHSLFTWPKNFAAGFVVAAILLVVLDRRSPLLRGSLIGLGYWAHPYVAFLAVPFVVYELGKLRHDRRGVIVSLSAAALPPALWLACTAVVWRIPSDLLQQNIRVRVPVTEFLWVRISNTFNTLFPTVFAGPLPPLQHLLSGLLISLFLACGMLWFFIPAAAMRTSREHLPILAIAGVGGLLIIALFGIVVQPMMHGWQAIVPLVVAMSLSFLQREHPRLVAPTFAGTLVLYSMFYLGWATYFVGTGAR